MTDKLNKMKTSLTKNLPVKDNPKYIISKDIKDDYEFSRETYKNLIKIGSKSLDALAELARESEHPRAFEVLSKSIKDIGDTTEKLMALQKANKELTAEEREEVKKLTQNNVFIGSTTDLQRLLLDKDKDRIINAEDQE
jgi:hypothetical protein|tara:strand:+ start:3249 stop:3665 length:417 start_codon:yes stop_codon:yes gene_type:complete